MLIFLKRFTNPETPGRGHESPMAGDGSFEERVSAAARALGLSGFGFWVCGLGIWSFGISGFRVLGFWGFGFGVLVLEFWALVFNCKVQLDLFSRLSLSGYNINCSIGFSHPQKVVPSPPNLFRVQGSGGLNFAGSAAARGISLHA